MATTPAVLKSRWTAIAALVVLVVAVGVGWMVLGRAAPAPPAAAPPPAPAVGVRPAAMKGVSQSFEFVGRIKATDKVEVRARVEGFLDKVLFREGQDVKEGDLLYQIEKVQFQAALTQAQTNLDYTDIRAPIAGRIGRTAYTVGNLVNPASGILATIVSQDPIYVLFPVSVRDLDTIREARRKNGGEMAKIDIRVRLPNGTEYSHPGVWNLTDPQVDPQTDTLIMRATIPNPERTLTDGQFVTAIIRERQDAPRLVVPQAALQVDQSGYYVLVVNDQHKVEQRRVQTGPSLGTDVVVTSGLKEGDKVIVDGIQKVRPGQVVQETVMQAASGG